MDKQDYIFLFFVLCLIVYNVVVRFEQVRRSKNRKILRELYPDGFIRHRKIYTFTAEQNGESPLPHLRRSDDKIFKTCKIEKKGLIDCRYDFEGFVSDMGGGE